MPLQALLHFLLKHSAWMDQKSVTLSQVKTSQITKDTIKREKSTQRAWTALLEGAEEPKSILTERQKELPPAGACRK